MRIKVWLFNLLFASQVLYAQDTPFRPPVGAPAMGDPSVDFDDMDEDLIEMGDDGFRPPPPPPPTSGVGSFTPPVPDRPSSSGGETFGAPGVAPKVKFKIVENEFWEKGKKSARGRK